MKQLAHYLHPVRYVTIGYQLLFLVVTITMLSLFIYKPFVEFYPVGPAPIIKPVDEQILKNWGKAPSRVRVGMHVTDFLQFDTVKNEFTINAFIWFDYDKDQVSSEFINAFAFTKGKIIQKSAPLITQHGSITRALYSIRVRFSTILDFSRFPLDDHRIFLNLVNPQASADQVLYESNYEDFMISPNIFISGWQVVGHSVHSGYAEISLNKQDILLQNKTVFVLDLSKGDVRQLMLILLPLLFLFYLGLFSFSIQDVTIAMTLPLASISGLFAYSFVIQIIAPMVGYMMLSDYLFFFFLISIFIICLVKALAAVPETHLSRHRLRTIEGVTILVLQLLLIIVWYRLLAV